MHIRIARVVLIKMLTISRRGVELARIEDWETGITFSGASLVDSFVMSPKERKGNVLTLIN